MFATSLKALLQVFGHAFHPNMQAMAAKEYAGDPTSNVEPDFIGQFCVDTAGGHLYWNATGAAAGWKKLNN